MGRRKGAKSRRVIAVCPRCWAPKALTRHHILPLRWFPGSRAVLLICRTPCHDEIELQIHREEMLHGGALPQQRYVEIAVDFIRGSTHRNKIGFNGRSKR